MVISLEKYAILLFDQKLDLGGYASHATKRAK